MCDSVVVIEGVKGQCCSLLVEYCLSGAISCCWLWSLVFITGRLVVVLGRSAVKVDSALVSSGCGVG
jgi:hypothetical protein